MCRLPGVQAAQVNFAAAQMSVTYEAAQTPSNCIVQAIRNHGVFASLASLPGSPQNKVTPFLVDLPRSAALFAAVLLASLTLLPNSIIPAICEKWLLLGAMVLGGSSPIHGAIHAVKARSLDMNVLVTLAVLGAIGLGDWSEGAAVVLLFQIGNLLQVSAMDRTRRSLRALIDSAPKTARVIRQNEAVELPISQLRIGDTIQVRPGERIPTDGTIIEGSSTANEASLTGESLPVEKTCGDTVFGGTLNGQGSLLFRVTHVYSETLLARIIHQVEQAQAERAPIQQTIDRFAAKYTPFVIGLAVFVATVPPVVLNLTRPADPLVWSEWFARALSLLLIACPCALVISTPVALIAAIGQASKNGILIKNGAALEAFAKLRVLVCDKTGTLTQGVFRVVCVESFGRVGNTEILRIAAAMESRSEHPLAEAIRCATETPKMQISDFIALPGLGVQSAIGGVSYLLGNVRLMRENGIDTELSVARWAEMEASGRTTILLSSATELLGMITLADTPRPETAETVHILQADNLRLVMATGDNAAAAKAVANTVGIEEIHAQLLPGDKLALVQKLQHEHGFVGMIGDGINDAPALAAAQVGIVMGIAGSDTAMETADIALMRDDLSALPLLRRLSRKTQSVLWQNITFAVGIKILLLATACFVRIPLWAAVLGDSGVALAVTLNSLRLRF